MCSSGLFAPIGPNFFSAGDIEFVSRGRAAASGFLPGPGLGPHRAAQRVGRDGPSTRCCEAAKEPSMKRFQPAVESLETRNLLIGGISLAANIVRITGTAFADQAVVRIDDGGTADAADDKVIVRLSHSGHTHHRAFALPKVRRIVFTGGAGNDRFQDFTPLPSVARGGKGNDTLLGGPEDTLLGGAGHNVLLQTVYQPPPGNSTGFAVDLNDLERLLQRLNRIKDEMAADGGWGTEDMDLIWRLVQNVMARLKARGWTFSADGQTMTRPDGVTQVPVR